MDNIEENIEESIPLTKPKRQVTQQPQEPVAQPVIEQPPAKKKRVMTKPKTPAQLAAFEKARLKRQENAANRQKAKDLEYAKLLAEHQKQEQQQPPKPQPPELQPPKRQVATKQKPRKSRAKFVYIQSSSSESESESDSEPEIVVHRGRRAQSQPHYKKIQSSSSEENDFNNFFV